MEINGIEYYDSLLDLPIINYHYILKNISEPKKAMHYMLKGKFSLKGEIQDEMLALKLLDVFQSFKAEKYEIIGMEFSEINNENLLLRYQLLVYNITHEYITFNANEKLDETSKLNREVYDFINELDDVCYSLDNTKRKQYTTKIKIFYDVIKFCNEINHYKNVDVYNKIIKNNVDELNSIPEVQKQNNFDLFEQKILIERVLKLSYTIDLYKTSVIEWFSLLKQSSKQAEHYDR